VRYKYPFWPFYTSIGFLTFGFLLIVLKAGVRTSLIFFIIAIILLIYWTYLIIRIDIKNNKKNYNLCICNICNHKQSNICIKKKCPCCISAKDNEAIEHSNNPF
jgi:hypothetical protein